MLGGPYVALSALDPLHGPLVKNRCNKTSMNLPMCCSRGKFLPWPWRDRQWQPRSRASACWCCRCSPQRTVVNFIINLQAAFALIFFCKKIQSQTVIREKLLNEKVVYKMLMKLTPASRARSFARRRLENRRRQRAMHSSYRPKKKTISRIFSVFFSQFWVFFSPELGSFLKAKIEFHFAALFSARQFNFLSKI